MGSCIVQPTRYSGLSNDSLHAMYRQSVYANLTPDMKLDLLQETVNRDSVERGMAFSPRVEFADLPANESGYAANGVITLNRDIAVDGVQRTQYNGQTIEHRVDDYNIQTLNTIFHENTHCYQDQLLDGTIEPTNPDQLAQYQANNFDVSAVQVGGNYQLGSQYLTGSTPGGYYLYYCQSTERDAFRTAEIKTQGVLDKLTGTFGTEPSFEAYSRTVAATGFQANMERAQALFQNPNFEHDVNQTLMNQFYGTNHPVDPATANAVKAEMAASYKELYLSDTQSKEETKMAFDPNKPVSLEEYNQTFRDTVNAYYTHALQDPTMSREEAIRTTQEMSEQYLTAVEEFQAAQQPGAAPAAPAAQPGITGTVEAAEESTAVTAEPAGISSGNSVTAEAAAPTVEDAVGAEDSSGPSNDEDCEDDLSL